MDWLSLPFTLELRSPSGFFLFAGAHRQNDNGGEGAHRQNDRQGVVILTLNAVKGKDPEGESILRLSPSQFSWSSG